VEFEDGVHGVFLDFVGGKSQGNGAVGVFFEGAGQSQGSGFLLVLKAGDELDFEVCLEGFGQGFGACNCGGRGHAKERGQNGVGGQVLAVGLLDFEPEVGGQKLCVLGVGGEVFGGKVFEEVCVFGGIEA